MPPPTVRLPAGPVTPHGAYHILHDRIPQMGLRAYDNSIVLHLMGGLAIPDRQMPERVELTGMTGLIPPWQTIDQKGATEDGVTFIDALYDPMEVTLETVCHGRNPSWCRKVVNWLIGSLDAKKESELFWFTHEMGRWWAPVRWWKTPTNPFRVMKRQPMQLRLRADSAFWQSYPDVTEFGYAYTAVADDFDTDTDTDMGDDYTISYTGDGGGFMHIHDGALVWVDDPADPILTGGLTGVFRRDGYATESNNQVIETTLGSFSEWTFPDNAETILGGRMPATGTPGDTGIFVDFGPGWCRLQGKVAGSVVWTWERPILIPPLPRERWTLIIGYDGNERTYKVRRNFGLGIGVEVLTYCENGTATLADATHRCVGGGMRAGAAVLTQATPATMLNFYAGTNSSDVQITQSGFVECINAGDQDMWKTYTCFGPGTFAFANGPGSTDMVQFGPLNSGQVAQVRSDPRKYGVKDLTSSSLASASPTQQKNLLGEILSFVTFNSVTHIVDVFQSVFGLLGGGSAAIIAPQGNLYPLLKGRFSTPIPAKSPGNPAVRYHVKVSITGGNADSKIIAAGTPLRRYPF